MPRKTAAITALVPPEVVYSSGWKALDINNGIPASEAHPKSKLCAWTASWREAILKGAIRPDALVVVAGGDCHNALADGQVAARKVPAAHFFFYPFDGDAGYLKEQLESLEEFLLDGKSEAAAPDTRVLSDISEAKKLGMELDKARSDGTLDPEKTFNTLISFSDLEGDPIVFRKKVEMLLAGRKTGGAPKKRMGEFQKRRGGEEKRRGEPRIGVDSPRVALIGVPPIYRDFHLACADAGLHVVFDELPYEFLRLGGKNMDEWARSYSTYTFARPVEFRLKALNRELAKRRIDGIVHYTQFTCHHILEDGLFRQELDWPMLTVQGDLPGWTPAQIRLRLEAFGELLGSDRRSLG
jgi:benzoyl-CoA reductase/2-hydroxyglutaryl-CoA dehydratase subunit BcrC/BadD/HgdB